MSENQKMLRLYNTLTRSKEEFVPIDPENVRMYVCGPTVYDFAHIGNARPVIVFDVLFRLLRHLYGADHVTYVRNITDVDDKINARAARDFPGLLLNEAIRKVTEKTANQFHEDVGALGCLAPTHEPRATEFVLPREDGKADMVTLIQRLIERGHAYESSGEVLFDTASMADYGQLSRRNLDEQQAGARVAVEKHKKNPADFVLWKQSSPEEPGWDSPWGRGRPGWHIECSAMSEAYLGQVFDIHGGGLDLIFPHHENEIAQSRCAHGTDVMANVWMHNGFLQVEGQKMSKSLGNFVTIRNALRRSIGDAVRWTMLKTHYRQPIDYSELNLLSATRELAKLCEAAYVLPAERGTSDFSIDHIFLSAVSNDLDLPQAIARLHEMYAEGKRVSLRYCLEFLGIAHIDEPQIFNRAVASYGNVPEAVLQLAVFWKPLQANKLQEAEELADQVRALGWDLLLQNGSVDFVKIDDRQISMSEQVNSEIQRRLSLIAKKSWPEADRIRDELLAQGIQLKDGKDPVTGERVTTWEVKR